MSNGDCREMGEGGKPGVCPPPGSFKKIKTEEEENVLHIK
jgi:hypothetical protein